MPSERDSFLPRIQSVFYAVFDLKLGPKIVYQVPEGSIAISPSSMSTSSIPASPTVVLPSAKSSDSVSRSSTSSVASPLEPSPGSVGLQSLKRATSSTRILFHFDDISKYVIPHSALCGRLVTCATRRCRVIGFPAELKGQYERNYFRYNVCFVFDRTADLSCYEPIVRKVSRVLKSCEEESAFLSSPPDSTAIPSILEQLYEDLNSYSETSIPIDKFNSIELKIFPFYPNPASVKDWMVPLALINLTKRIESNWDLTMQRICQFIDGINHVARIAQLADCDLELARLSISHLLYHQVIMMIDIFQYSNMYTLQRTIQRLADEAHVREECGPYVTKLGKPIPDWPTLLYLYSRLKSGTTVYEWMKTYHIQLIDIDVRRFTSFGVIKGFLRRVHRWPVLLSEGRSADITALGRRRGGSISNPGTPTLDSSGAFVDSLNTTSIFWPLSKEFTRGRSPQHENLASTVGEFSKDDSGTPAPQRVRKQSAAETVLEQLRAKDSGQLSLTSTGGRRNSWLRSGEDSGIVSGSPDRRIPASSQISGPAAKPASTTFPRPRISRSPSAPAGSTSGSGPVPPTRFPSEMLAILDGEHHTDELSTKFQVGWPLLEQWLVSAGGGIGNGDYGRISIIYR